MSMVYNIMGIICKQKGGSTMEKITLRFFDPKNTDNQCIIDDISNWSTAEIQTMKEIQVMQGRTEHEFIIINNKKKED